tara:strand:+ start:1018 stop:1584 length:567 start_codon:yes stop_codon:yes gene_type:complete
MALAESFAVIVGLISQFKSEKDSNNKTEFNEFIQWLNESHHQEVIDMLALNTKATIYIKALMNQDREWLKEKLEKIDNALTAYASSIEGFSDLANAIKPNAILSNQSIDILRQFDSSGASKVLKHSTFSGTTYIYLDGQGEISISDERFAIDDFDTLIQLGLLKHDFNSKGEDIYIFTRVASELVKNV